MPSTNGELRGGIPGLASELNLGGPGPEQLEGGLEGSRVQSVGERVVEGGKWAGEEVASRPSYHRGTPE
mgnify:CR=1 FL=1